MFVAMNRSRVVKGHEPAFEEALKARDPRLSEMEGFEAWTRSEQLREAHREAGRKKPLTLGHPEFVGFGAVQGA